MSTFLLVDDDVNFVSRMASAIAARGHHVSVAHDYTDAVQLARGYRFDYALVDVRLPALTGIDLTAALLQLQPALHIVVLTGYGSIATAVSAMQAGARHYLTKPADPDEVLATFARAEKSALPPKPVPAPSLARVEWEHIQRVLQDCSGNVTKAAEMLGIHRRSLQRKLAKAPPDN